MTFAMYGVLFFQSFMVPGRISWEELVIYSRPLFTSLLLKTQELSSKYNFYLIRGWFIALYNQSCKMALRSRVIKGDEIYRILDELPSDDNLSREDDFSIA